MNPRSGQRDPFFTLTGEANARIYTFELSDVNSPELETFVQRPPNSRVPRHMTSSFVSAREAAELTGVSAKTVRRWIAANRLHAVKNGRSFRISVSELEDVYGRPIVDIAAPTSGETGDAPSPPSSRFVAGIHEGGTAAVEPTEANHLARLVRDLIAELVEASARTAALRLQCETLTSQLERAQEAAREAQRAPRRAVRR
jgi:excisionase family DNA binding protein